MKCPNCDNSEYEIGTPCSSCNHYELPQYWDMGWCAIFIEHKNWAVLYNGVVIEKELASKRDAWDKAGQCDQEMREASTNSWREELVYGYC